MRDRRWFLLGLPLVVALGAGSCNNQNEGERCDIKSGNKDCQSGLFCVSSGDLLDHTVGDRCCPAQTTASTNVLCRLGSGLSTGGSAGAGAGGEAAFGGAGGSLAGGGTAGTGTACLYNSDCAPNEVCGPTGHCQPQCRADRDCTAPLTCDLTSSTCVVPEVGTGGTGP